MADRVEAIRRGQSPHKTGTKHPYAAIEHRVIDSPAYADLTFSAQALLVLLARQLTASNNGHLNAAFKFCQRHGFGSEHTLRAAIAELISHGFIFRTRSHGANKAWAHYAVTWKPISEKAELFLENFKPCAWREWEPSEEKPKAQKSTPQKVPEQSSRKCSFTPEHPADSAGMRGAKSADYELMPCRAAKSADAWLPDYVARLSALGLAHACPVAIQ